MSAAIGVGSELRACLALVRHMFHARLNKGSNWLSWLFLGSAVLAPIVAGAITGKWARSIAIGAGIPLAVLAALWWVLLVASLAHQNGPSARLVPGIGRRSIAVLVSGACTITLGLTSLFVLGGGAALPGAVLVMLALVIATAWMAVPGLGWWLYALVFGQIFFTERLKALLPFPLEDVIATAGPVLILPLGIVALRAIISGVAQAEGMFTKIARLSRENGAQGTLPAFGRRLRRDCEQGRIGALLMHAAGPQVRTPSPQFFLVAGVLALAIVLAFPGWAARNHTVLRALIPALMVALQVALVPSMVQAIYRTRREQALVRLAARVPDSRSINASLARSLLFGYARCWLGSTMLTLVFLYALGVPVGVMLRILAVFLATLAWGGLLLRGYASESEGKGSAGTRMLVLLAACCLVLAAPAPFLRPQPWLFVGACTLAVGLVIAVLRWKRMLRAPAAYPAGRMR